ncbi:hypothetical protein ARALYDRAFT_478160, partial [Arabidopsis lyrata subsp. lyrata]
VTNPDQDSTLEVQETEPIKEEQSTEKMKKQPTPLRPVERQLNVKSKGMGQFGDQWLSSVTRHVRIYAAYIDPETCEFDQSQMDKLTLILDPTEEFVWDDESCNKVYSYFQELVDHYEGAPLTEYTLRLIGCYLMEKYNTIWMQEFLISVWESLVFNSIPVTLKVVEMVSLKRTH